MFLDIFVIKITKIIIIIIIETIIIIIKKLVIAQNFVSDVQKRGPSCPNCGQGWGLVNSGNAWKKMFFLIDVFPNDMICLILKLKDGSDRGDF